ncbi:MAG: 1-deoxy-D-xylulose-5-phosphate synthase, partial [Escherichia coli]|nr:1-deoxy-D-xylulose-5-phosphate synthase [Escherichia coli]
MSFDIAKYPTLALVDSTQELRLLPKESLPKLCDELRRYLLDSVSRSSGHFASGLGTVELTVALHYVYNTPFDQLIWDVGHQAYPHKILTGRRDKIGTIRQKGGLHPFPWRGESEYDVLSVGHSSTSISAGIGIAVAAEKEGKNRRTVCVIGDGAITAGMAFEAMNHAGDIRPDMLVVLNDNEMSISENVGALNNHLAQLLSGITTLKNMRDLKGPQFLHIMTKKGRGYEPAEKDPITFHAVPKFDPSSGCLPKSSGGLPSYSKIFGDWLCETAAKDNKLMAITPAMREGSGMVEFSRKFPDRYFDVAIAEQHAVTFAAGLAIGGYKPIVAIYSTFLQRAYDQVLHDVAIQKLPVLFAIDRAGIVGADGQTHQGAFDLSYLRCIPEMVIMTPSDENECRQMLYTGYHYNDGPSAVRYPRGNAVGVELTPLEKLPIGKGIVKRRGEKLAILNFGTLMPDAAKVAESLNATLVDMRFVK